MAGLINWKKVAIPGVNPDTDHVYIGVDVADGQFYIKDNAGVVTKYASNASVSTAIAAALSNYDLSTIVDSKIATAISGLIDSAPGTLDTLDELAAALGDDDNFAATIATQQAAQNSRLTTLEAHPPLTTNPHDTNLLNLSDISTSSYSSDAFYAIKANAAADGAELFRLFEQTATRDTPLLHQSSATFANYLTMTVEIPVTGNYLFMMTHRFSINSTTVNFQSHLEKGGDFFLINHVELQDASGTGIVVPNTTGGTSNTGTDNFQTRTGIHKFVNLIAGTHVFNLEFNGQIDNQEPTIYDASMYIKRLIE